ncbi:subtilisin-like protein [Athelia psychrophila]|uniref:tripeptidyl-peptidase II n=1 Tax=Athelia psychrophila TaxID=1759441 RepID=A0A165Y522_9AGAM|nr:subtilisin-like protein [Fibularhizoctonia sp. CBS 109695]
MRYICSLIFLYTGTAVSASNLAKKSFLHGPPSGWERLEAPPSPDHLITLQIGLKQHNFEGLVEELYKVSDPDHPSYGNHLSKSEAEEFVKPHPESLVAVNEWLRQHSVDLASVSRSPAGDWATLTVPISRAEAMLGSKYHVFRHRELGGHAVRTLEYSVPRDLDGHIDTVQPTTYFPPQAMPDSRLSKRSSLSRVSAMGSNINSSCNLSITPNCLRTLYKLDNYTASANSTNRFGIASYAGDYASNEDLQAFFKQYRPEAKGSNFTIVLVNGGKYNGSDFGDEATLDVQYATSLSYPTPNIVYSTGGAPPFTPDYEEPSNTNEPYLDWVQYVLNETHPPQTFTTSYADNEQTVPLDYAQRVCNSFAQLGARGVSLLFGSGDGGVGGGDSCTTNDGTNKTMFQPTFPASCPYVTVVGGTAKVNPEVAADGASGANFVTGGGFSNYFPQPSYQSGAVNQYLKAFGTNHSDLYNASGRAYPDIAANGNYFAIIEGGETYGDSGTSASTPVAAAVIALLNDYLISQGKPPLGFLNPFLYSKGYKGFKDIVSGGNEGCGTDGFKALKGWDPVTGFGTPDFVELQKLV